MGCYPGGILSDINYPLCSYIPHTNTISEAELELPNSQDIEYKVYVDSVHNSYINLPVIPYTDEEQWIR